MSNIVRQAAAEYGPENILIASFTRAAAAEIAGRGLPLQPHQIGTLHAHSYRALNHPRIAETLIGEWNESNPDWVLGGSSDLLDEPETETRGDSLGERVFQEYQILRARMTPREEWPPLVQTFATKWDAWKDDLGLLDFTDLIEICLKEHRPPPGHPQVIFQDEAQDYSTLEMALIRQWAQKVDRLYVAGDSDQAIFSFKGADGSAFWKPAIDPANKSILSQSYRVPRVVQEYATRWIEQIEDREDAAYNPRAAEGKLSTSRANWQEPDRLLQAVEEQLSRGDDVMILTSCAYMLEPLIEEARNQGQPFGNRFRRKNGRWNPLHASRGVTASQRLLSFLQPQEYIHLERAHLWSVQELDQWTKHLEAKGTLKKGAKAKLVEMKGSERSLSRAELEEILEPMALDRALDGDLEWYADHLLASKKRVFEYPLRIIEKVGITGLQREPKLSLGTVHSVKGATTGTVLLCPDISRAGYEEWEQRGSGHDAMIRMMYVGMTRARDELILAAPGTGLAIPFLPTGGDY